MSDQGAAQIYRSVFRALRGAPDQAWARAVARRLWKESFEYDFSPEEMCAYRELSHFDLAKMGKDPEYPEDGKVRLYADQRGRFPK